VKASERTYCKIENGHLKTEIARLNKKYSDKMTSLRDVSLQILGGHKQPQPPEKRPLIQQEIDTSLQKLYSIHKIIQPYTTQEYIWEMFQSHENLLDLALPELVKKLIDLFVEKHSKMYSFIGIILMELNKIKENLAIRIAIAARSGTDIRTVKVHQYSIPQFILTDQDLKPITWQYNTNTSAYDIVPNGEFKSIIAINSS